MENPWRYRNKAQVPIGEHEGGLIGGFYQQRSHQIINMQTCLIQQEKNDEVVKKVKEICSTMVFELTMNRSIKAIFVILWLVMVCK